MKILICINTVNEVFQKCTWRPEFSILAGYNDKITKYLKSAHNNFCTKREINYIIVNLFPGVGGQETDYI